MARNVRVGFLIAHYIVAKRANMELRIPTAFRQLLAIPQPEQTKKPLSGLLEKRREQAPSYKETTKVGSKLPPT